MRSRHLKGVTETNLAAVSIILTFLWFFLMLFTMQTYQNLHSTDPLSLIDVLFPHFWILLILLACVSLLTLFLSINVKWLHMLLLGEFALILIYTPFFMSGFSWSPDSLWHGGIASYMPQILSGSNVTLSRYAGSYPLSYLLTYCVEQISGLSVFQYTLYVFPVISILTITTLAYTFIQKLVNGKVAFLAMLMTIPTWHFIEPHTSPFATGTILVLGAFLLLTVAGRKSKATLFFLIFAGVLTHPVSPLSLEIFLVGVVVLSLFIKIIMPKASGIASEGIFSRISFETVLFVGIVWFLWTTSWASNVYKSVGYTISRVITFQFLSELTTASEFTTGGGFLYRDISLINQIVYVTFGIFAALLILVNFGSWLRRKKGEYFGALETLFGASAILYAGYAYLLFLSTGDHHLLSRGLVFFVLAGSATIAIRSLKSPRRIKLTNTLGVVSAGLVIFFLVTFPYIAYSIESYNSYTPSSGYGLSFLANNVDLTHKTLTISGEQQLASYVNLTQISEDQLIEYTTNFTEIFAGKRVADFIVIRSNSYFVSALRYDLNLTTNSLTLLRSNLRNNASYDLIYSNPSFEVYAFNRGSSP